MSVKVKICDIRDIKTIETCIKCGVDYIGLHAIYAEDLNERKLLFFNKVKSLANKKVKLVLVTREARLDLLLKMCCTVDFDYVQLHFPISVEDFSAFLKSLEEEKCHTKVIPVFAGANLNFSLIRQLANMTEFILFDTSYHGGTGTAMESDMYRTILNEAKGINYFIAGGLKENNVGSIIDQTKPYAVDVQSGVEIKKRKDDILIQRFVTAAKTHKV